MPNLRQTLNKQWQQLLVQRSNLTNSGGKYLLFTFRQSGRYGLEITPIDHGLSLRPQPNPIQNIVLLLDRDGLCMQWTLIRMSFI